ncbi:uncharacterized protein B0H18DRAFT_1012456 [Fomitopsis serialis]|uniref:uncharacterized protein n=1 Tax=Fomitopsis serialis TaxID=139415 RepID=UPI002007B627|nr:uncharacterized protein B0H18DRAFT_1012456 [Neoantrodia serialis]KAH9924484.1 hypothetical protein B0H18DRAFT_1012456 [Neoantrodia serialis]
MLSCTPNTSSVATALGSLARPSDGSLMLDDMANVDYGALHPVEVEVDADVGRSVDKLIDELLSVSIAASSLMLVYIDVDASIDVLLGASMATSSQVVGLLCMVSDELAVLDEYALKVDVDAPSVLDCTPAASQGIVLMMDSHLDEGDVADVRLGTSTATWSWLRMSVLSCTQSDGLGVDDNRVFAMKPDASVVLGSTPNTSCVVAAPGSLARPL